MSKSNPKDEFHSTYCSTEEAALILRTNPVSLRQSRVAGVLWGRPAPVHLKVGERKVLYRRSDLIAWIEEAPNQRVANSKPVSAGVCAQ